MNAEHHSSLCCALEVTSDLPSEETIEQWLAEPVKLLILPTSIFLTNSTGFPVLSKRHQVRAPPLTLPHPTPPQPHSVLPTTPHPCSPSAGTGAAPEHASTLPPLRCDSRPIHPPPRPLGSLVTRVAPVSPSSLDPPDSPPPPCRHF